MPRVVFTLPDGTEKGVQLGGFPTPEDIEELGGQIGLGGPPPELPNAPSSSTTTTPVAGELDLAKRNPPGFFGAAGQTALGQAKRLGHALIAPPDPSKGLAGLPFMGLAEFADPFQYLGGTTGETYARMHPEQNLSPEDARFYGQMAGGVPTLARTGIGLAGRGLNYLRSETPIVKRIGMQLETLGNVIDDALRVRRQPAAGRSVRAIGQTRNLNLEAEAQQAGQAVEAELAGTPLGRRLDLLAEEPPPQPIPFLSQPAPVTRADIPPRLRVLQRESVRAGERSMTFSDRVAARLNRLDDAAVSQTLARNLDLQNRIRAGATPGELAAIDRAIETGTRMKLPYTRAQLAGRTGLAYQVRRLIQTGFGHTFGGPAGAAATYMATSEKAAALVNAAIASPRTARILADAMALAPDSPEYARAAAAFVNALSSPGLEEEPATPRLLQLAPVEAPRTLAR